MTKKFAPCHAVDGPATRLEHTRSFKDGDVKPAWVTCIRPQSQFAQSKCLQGQHVGWNLRVSSAHGHVIGHVTVCSPQRHSTTTTIYETYKSKQDLLVLGSATMDAPNLNPLAVKLPPPPTDPTVHLPLAPHSPPLMEDVHRAIQYHHQVDVSHCMSLGYITCLPFLTTSPTIAQSDHPLHCTNADKCYAAIYEHQIIAQAPVDIEPQGNKYCPLETLADYWSTVTHSCHPSMVPWSSSANPWGLEEGNKSPGAPCTQSCMLFPPFWEK